MKNPISNNQTIKTRPTKIVPNKNSLSKIASTYIILHIFKGDQTTAILVLQIQARIQIKYELLSSFSDLPNNVVIMVCHFI